MNLKIRRILSAVLVLALVVGFLPILDLGVKASAATEPTTAVYDYVADISQYRKNTKAHDANNDDKYDVELVYDDYPAKDGYVFAGWFVDGAKKTPLAKNVTTGGAYAKFVPEKLMKAVAQVSTIIDYTTDSAALRFVAAVDSLDYAQVGFLLNKEGSAKTYTHGATTVYTSLSAAVEGGSLAPTYFHSIATHMFSLTISGIKDQGANYVATPFWITYDGTKVDHIPTENKAVEMGVDANVAAGKTEIPENLAWYKDSADVLYINTKDEFVAFVEMSNTNNFAGKTIKLNTDIVYQTGDWSTAKATWTPIGTDSLPFAGTFDGQGHSISGLMTQKSTGGKHGLFGVINGATIKNVKILGSTFHPQSRATYYAGSVAAHATNSTISNVYSDAVLYAAEWLGGIVGHAASNVTVENCWFDGTIHSWNTGTTTLLRHGGIIARAAGAGVSVSNCLFTGAVDGVYGHSTADSTSYLGGLIGMINYNVVVTITHSLSAGDFSKVTVTSGAQAGSVIGSGSGKAVSGSSVYATNECYSVASTGRPENIANLVTLVNEADILGELAKTNAPNLDYTVTWTTVSGSTPALRMADPKAAVDTSWYNDTDTEFTLYTAAELNGLAYLSKTNTFAGKTVKLGADITYNTGNAADWAAAAPAYSWTPIGPTTANLFSGNFDGQGHTLSGLYCAYTESTPAGVFGALSSATVRNLNVTNSYFAAGNAQYWGRCGVVAYAMSSTIANIYTDAILVGGYAAGIVGHGRKATTISNCWFDGSITVPAAASYHGGILGMLENNADTSATITNCLFTGTMSGGNSSSACAGGIVGHSFNNLSNITLTNCLSAGDMSGVASAANAGSVFGSCAYNGAARVTVGAGVYATNECYAKDGTVYPISSGRYGAAHYTGTFNLVDKATILGETAKTTLSGLTFDDPKVRMGWLARSNDVPALDSYEIDGIDLTWYDANAAEYVLMDAEDLLGFAYLGSTGGVNFSGKTIKLGADIVLNTGDASTWGTNPPANAWTPITTEFKGTFDGDGHTISGLYLNSSAPADSYDGMFKLSGGAIKNVTFENSYVTGTGKIGAIIGAMTGGSVTNVHVKGTVKGGDYVGGLIGYHAGGSAITIDGCSFDGAISGGSNLGGIISLRQNAGNETIKNCTVSGTITGTGTRLGGIAGFAGNSSGTILIENCNVSANINTTHTGQNECGGIVGNYLGATVTVRNCHYTGKLTAGGYGNGGIVGAAKVNTTIENCSFTGEIDAGNHWLGGMVGYVYGGTITLNNDMSTGKIVSKHASNSAIGSMIGRNNGGTVNATGCFGVLNAYYKTSTLKEGQIGQGTVNGDTALISNKVRALMEEYYNAGIALDFTNGFAKYWATSTPFEISTVGQFFAFNLMGQCYDFSGKTVKLTADITINSGNASDWVINAPKYNWTPIGGMSGAPVTKFAGTFDGQGHTISGIYCAFPSGNSMGLFRENSGTITNFKLVNSYLVNTDEASGWGYNGVIASCMSAGTISKVYTDAIIHSVDSYAGGIVGNTTGTTVNITECQFDGQLIARCTLDGTCAITGGQSRAHASWVGGMVGAGTATNTNISNCYFTGSIYNECGAAHRTGGIIGGPAAAGKAVTVTGCISIGKMGTLRGNNSYHFSMIMDGRVNTDTGIGGPTTNSATLFDTNYVLTTPAYGPDGVTTINGGGNISGEQGGKQDTARYTEEQMITDIEARLVTDTSKLDFTVWNYNPGQLPTLKCFGGETATLNTHYITTDTGAKLLAVSMNNASYDTFTDMTIVETEYTGDTYALDGDGDGTPETYNCLYLEQVNSAPVEFKDIFYGYGTYLTKYTGTNLAAAQKLVSDMKAYGFEEYVTNNLNEDCYYTALTYGGYAYTVTHFVHKGETYVSASYEQKFSPFMNSEYFKTAVNTEGGEPSSTHSDVKITSVALRNGGDAFIIRLKNGHYIVVDGGTNNPTDRDAVTAALGADAAEYNAGTKNNPRVVVDAWFFTHAHADHTGLFRGGIHGGIQVDVYVKGFYYNFTEKWHKDQQINVGSAAEPNYVDGYVNLAYAYKDQDKNGKNYYTKGHGDTAEWWVERTTTAKVANNVNTPAWGTKGIPVYRVQAGQKFYFDGMTVEVPYTQEQVQPHELNLDLNGTCSWFLFTDDYGNTFMDAGDAEFFNAEAVTELYSAEYGVYGADVCKTFHHGLNPLVKHTGTFGEYPGSGTVNNYDYTMADTFYGINTGVGDREQTKFMFITKGESSWVQISGFNSCGGSQRDLSIHEMYYLFGYILTRADGSPVRDYVDDGYKTIANKIPFAAYGGDFSFDNGEYTDTFEGTTTVTMNSNGISYDKHHTRGIYG